MKKVSKNKGTRLAMVLFVLSLSVNAKAQLIDWIGEQIKGYIEDQVSSITHSNQRNLGMFGSMLWDGIVESKVESDIEDEVKKLRDLNISTGNYYYVDNKYRITQSDINYRKIYYNQWNLTKSFIYTEKQLPLNTLGGGQIQKSIIEYSDSINKESKIDNLSSELNTTAIEELNTILEKNDTTLPRLLLQDINENKRLLFAFNNHKGSFNVYANSLNSTLRTEAAHLIYWSSKATALRKYLPKKAQPIDPGYVKFVDSFTGANIVYNNKVIGKIHNNTVNCETIDLLNLSAMPNAVYKYNATEYHTDELGRVSVVSQLIQKDTRKCSEKSLFKAKYLINVLSNDKSSKAYALAFEKYGAPVTQINTLFFTDCKENKDAQKNVMKAIKQALKTNSKVIVVTEIKYINGSPIPKYANIKVGNNALTYKLSNTL